MTTRVMKVTVGSQYYNVTGYTYYGYDSGPNLFYGGIDSAVLVGADGKEYTVHGCRWAAESPNNRVYLRLNNPTISASDSYTSYTSLFSAITIGSATLTNSTIASGFTIDGAVAFYWNVPSNPFGSVGSITTLSFSGVNEGPFGLQVFDSSGALKVDITSALVAIAGVDSVTISANSSVQINIAGLDNSGVWKVFLEGFLYSGGFPLYYAISQPSVAYSSGYYTLTNNDSNYTWSGTSFVYRSS